MVSRRGRHTVHWKDRSKIGGRGTHDIPRMVMGVHPQLIGGAGTGMGSIRHDEETKGDKTVI